MIVQSVAGFLLLLGIAWILSEERMKVKPWPIVSGLAAQLVLAFLLLELPVCQDMFMLLNRAVSFLEQATTAGSSFVFGYLGGAPLPFEEKFPGGSFILAFRALPLILVVSALSSLLFYWKIIPLIVRGFSLLLQKTLQIGGALGVGAAANIFVGMVEAPLFIRPYLKRMTRSELFCVMTCGMATIAGTVMVLYASILQGVIPDAMGHILTASIISAPAALTIARVMVPGDGSMTSGDIVPPQEASSSMDAVTKGTTEGVQLLINIIAMLVVFVALVHLVNLLLGLLPGLGGEAVTLQRLLGFVMAPIAWLMGIPWSEAQQAGSLMGIKTIMNEFLAYLELAKMPAGTFTPRTTMIMTYAMCGFANFGSLGIMIGGLGVMAPERREEIVKLGIKSIIAGTLATCMTGAVVGIFY